MKLSNQDARRGDVRQDMAEYPNAERLQVLYERWMQAEQVLTQTPEKRRKGAQKAARAAYEAYHRVSRGTATVYRTRG